VEFLCQQVSHTFASIPKDVQYVYIEHGGSDSQFWRGHYGPKITATSVMVNCWWSCYLWGDHSSRKSGNVRGISQLSGNCREI